MKNFISLLSLTALLLLSTINVTAQSTYIGKEGFVKFVSNAEFEKIEATSDKLKGALKTSDKSFAFKLTMISFHGFNSPLQMTHFHENYVESEDYPNAVFKGKIIESVDLTQDGTYNVRAKGDLSIHGSDVNMTIPVSIVVKDGVMNVTSNFSIELEDFDIDVPSAVSKKIASEVDITVKMSLTKR